ncbi:ParB/RepB/Spo0J family partition protein [Boudabousia liubingyangii]|uniref:ParB/RepB/Spo0J family partition protein n=1 Tax=Boudabousia liubingyangii TaxID=1921764 RepID=UPI0009F8342E|nr:ParB/RepB/Spo0J family partition protein [Boudabousia liubingyangii]
MATKKRGGLGRGLSALIPDSQVEEAPPSDPLDVFFPSTNVSRETNSGSAAKTQRSSSDATEGRGAVTRSQSVRASRATSTLDELLGPDSDAFNADDTSKYGGLSVLGDPTEDPTPEVEAEQPKRRSVRDLLDAPKDRARAKKTSRGARGSASRDAAKKSEAAAKEANVSRETISVEQKSSAKASPSKAESTRKAQVEAKQAGTKKASATKAEVTRKSTATKATATKTAGSSATASKTSAKSSVKSGSNDAGKTAASVVEEANVSRETISDSVELAPVPGASFGQIPIWSIIPNRVQPRTIFDPEDLQELMDSIREVGILQPIVIRPLPEAEAKQIYQDRLAQAESRVEVPEIDEPLKAEGDLEALLTVDQLKQAGVPRYELIMGERRLRASRLAGLETIPAIIRRTEDSDLLRDALLENLHRAQLNPIEEAAAYQQLMEDFGCTQEQLSVKIARSRPQIANTMRLLKLPGSVQRMLAGGTISAGHARALLRLDEAADMQILAERIVAEGLSVRTVEELVAMGAVRGAAGKAKRAPKPRNLPDHLQRFATDLGDRLDTRVNIQLGKHKSKIIIESADPADLERIISILEGKA